MSIVSSMTLVLHSADDGEEHRLKSVPRSVLRFPHISRQDRLGGAILAAHAQDAAGLEARGGGEKRFFRSGHAHALSGAETGDFRETPQDRLGSLAQELIV